MMQKTVFSPDQKNDSAEIRKIFREVLNIWENDFQLMEVDQRIDECGAFKYKSADKICLRQFFEKKN